MADEGISIVKQVIGGVLRFVHKCFDWKRVTICIDRYWTDAANRCVQGWIVSRKGRIDGLEMRASGRWVPVDRLEPRSDLSVTFPDIDAGRGFSVQLHHGEPVRLRFRVKRDGRWTSCDVKCAPPQCREVLNVPDGQPLFERFISEVNEKRLNVLEIGSRIVSPGSASKRSLFPNAASYTGFDYYPDANTDLVGDAHRLSELVGDRRFDAVFSVAVFEHLAMPWVVAREISKILRPKGITYHGTLFSWPAHERPWDFWRMSDEGLKVLFSPALGYEVLGAGMFDPVSMHFSELRPGHEGFPHAAAYASSSILCRKTSDGLMDDFNWPSDLGKILDNESKYPEKA